MSWMICIIARPLVGAARSEVFDHVYVGGGRQGTIRLVRGRAAKIVEAVGQHADMMPEPLTFNPLSVEGLLHLCRSGAA